MLRIIRQVAFALLGGSMEYDEIFPQLFIGSRPQSKDDIERLRQECGITAVLNLQTDEDMRWCDLDWESLEAHYRSRGIELARVPVRDFDPEELREKLPECVRALDGLLAAGHSVYLHCTAGASRSPTVAIAYLHRCRSWELEQAAVFVRQRRTCSPELDAIRLANWEAPERGSEPSPETGKPGS